jgi:hypothetical protein
MTDSNPMPAFLADELFDGGVSARGESRDSLFLLAEIHASGWQNPIKVRVRNLSAGGMLAEFQEAVPVGTSMRIGLANIGWLTGRSVWAGEGRFGVAFDKQIDPQAVRRKPGAKEELPPTLLDMTLHTTKFKKPLRPV